ncbi:hypothetical protein GW758_02095 [Candidatus Falkowbacteria bacterium]|nr:hypothetical protein [Candidatus Falkowbacteria bacterium]NCT54733.1 hypothetical protein [Candidatus Falkowbacteria bacterium]
MKMNNFENPRDIINKEGLASEEKIAPIENAKVAQEQLSEIKSDFVKSKVLQKEISDKIDKYINDLSDAMKSQEHYQKELELHELQAELTSIIFRIEDKIEQLKFILSAMNKIKDLNQISTQN